VPYASEAQRRKFHALLAQGKLSAKVVQEWDDASVGLKLPEHVERTKSAAAAAYGTFAKPKAPGAPVFAKPPAPPKPAAPAAGDMPGSVTFPTSPDGQHPDYYGLGVPADQRKDRTPKDTAPVDGTRTAGDKRADELARMTERSNELAERHRQERDDDRESRERHRQYWDQHPDEYDSYLKDNPYVASLVDEVVQVLAEANPYSTSGNPYIPAQVPPGTPDDILDGPVNPAPQMLDVPMTTRPRQMPSGDSTLPPAEPGAGSKETL
jgi:hypothetical protein